MLTRFDIGAMTSQENQVKEIPIELLNHTHNHKFTMYDEEKRSDMTESIKKYGVMQPLIVRPDPEEVGKYEILAGNNRCRCSQDAGKTTCPAIIKENLTENEAQIYIAFTNLLQRGFNEIKITEQAAVIAAYHSELFSKEKASEIAQELAEMEGKPESKLEQAGKEYGLGKDTAARLIRISKLVPELKPWVDSRELSVRAAVDLSYIPEEGQKLLYKLLKDTDGNMAVKVDIKKARQLRTVFNENPEIERMEIEIYSILIPDEKKSRTIKLKPEFYERFFDKDTQPKTILETIEKALESYLQ